MDESEQEVQERIRSRVDRGDLLTQLLLLARGDSSDVQNDYIDALALLATGLRKVLLETGMVRRLEYEPSVFWPAQNGKCFGFIDGGVARIELPSAAPMGIRVGSYVVRPGNETDQREEFSIEFSLVDELYSVNSHAYDDIFEDTSKLVDAARMTLEAAAALQVVGRVQDLSAVFLHGPLVNPVSPYGSDDFPPFTRTLSASLTQTDPDTFDDRNCHFIPVYLRVLELLRDSDAPVIGVVERSGGRRPHLLNRILDSLQEDGKLYRRARSDLDEKISDYPVNDAQILGLILEPGEFTTPVSIARQGPDNKWPNTWKPEIRDFPKPLTTFLKSSENSDPVRIEMFENIEHPEGWLSVLHHTTKLLPNYGFPVGLDIVDKYAKVPAWMSQSVRGQYAATLLRKALLTGDPSALEYAKRIVAAKGRDWLFRPTA